MVVIATDPIELAEDDRQRAVRMTELAKVRRDFLNLAAHELRGPLGVLRGYVSMIEDGTLPAERLLELVPMLSAKLEQMEVLVAQMLETARLESGRLNLRTETFDVREMVARVFESFRPAAANHHRLVLDAPDRPLLVTTDRQRVETALSNLVDNAIKYSPEGGQVTCLVVPTADRMLVSVRDEGIGIASEDLARLFTPFERIVTTDTAHIGGTGLGLYLSREIVRQQGGDILVESTPGQGSVFTLTLPLQARRRSGPALPP